MELQNSLNRLQETLFSDTPVAVEDSVLPVYPFPLDTIGQRLPDGNPDLMVSKDKLSASEAESKAIRSLSWPDPFVRLSKTDVNGGDGFSAFEVGLKIPIDFWGEHAKNRSARIDAEIAGEQHRIIQKTLETEFQNLWNKVNNYHQQLKFFRENRLQEASLISKNATLQYREGNIDYLQYVQYFDQATTIRLDYLSLVKSYNEAVIELQYLTGRGLDGR
nr:TolC family protein [Anaerophaga thermohalophila]